ncbi:hypothetical protein K227x_31480 [Rubripirellula lacrimiformis]|uniref:Uncharacterized protein n=1 Tax=Rubripirellula lacrimiformis TaxID=1930273 RepID=A0A517NC82_9BACT|nr:hypothetical protein K227x_31480 [Rubripirellula lacrimiformis]
MGAGGEGWGEGGLDAGCNRVVWCAGDGAL